MSSTPLDVAARTLNPGAPGARGRCSPCASGRTQFGRRREGGIPGAAAVSVGAPGSAATMGILEKISEIEKEIARTQKNKGEGRPGGAFLSARLSFPVCKMGEQLRR